MIGRIKEENFLTKPLFFSLVLIVAFSGVVVLAQDSGRGLECQIVEGESCNDMVKVLSLFSDTNSHVASRMYFKDYSLCCEQDVHSGGKLFANIRDSPGDYEVPILSLYQYEDSHVEKPNLGNYEQQLSVSPFTECTLRNSSKGTVDERCADIEKEYLISLANITNSHVSNESSLYDYDLCCEIPEPDVNQTVCEFHDGWGGEKYWWGTEQFDTRWNVDTHPKYQTGEEHPGNTSCCGDEWANGVKVEWPRYREYGPRLPFEDDESDWACAVNKSSCVYENESYPECYEKNVTGDDYTEICWEGEWGLGREEGGRIRIDGSVMEWDTAKMVEGVNVTARLIFEGEIISESSGTVDENEQGSFVLSLVIPEEYMERGRTYTLQVITEKDGQRSYMEKDIIIHREMLAYIQECEERREDW